MEQIKIKLDGGMMPKKAHPTDAAADIYCPKDIDINRSRMIIDTGFAMELPHGYAAFVRSRSGYAAKGMEVNAVGFDGGERKIRIDATVVTGLIDEQYKDNVGIILIVRDVELIASYKRIYIPKGERIAQLQIIQVPETEFIEVDEIDMENNRNGGFGSTNK